jgi:CHAT domain-containing protein/tetratricopeptide (TPR) repeat protein
LLWCHKSTAQCIDVPSTIHKIDSVRNTELKYQIHGFGQILAKIQECPDTPDSLMGLVYHRLGTAYLANNYELDQAEKNLKKALDYKLKTFKVTHIEIANTYYNLATLYLQQSDLKNSSYYFQKALPIYVREKHFLLHSCYIQLANINIDVGDYEKASDLANKAIMASSNSLEKIESYITFGIGKYESQHYKEALDSYNKAEVIFRKDTLFNIYEYAVYNLNVGNTYLKLKKYPQSISFYERAIVTYSPEAKSEILRAKYNISVAYREMGDQIKARQILVLNLPQTKSLPNIKALFYNNLGKIEETTKSPKALAYFQEAVGLSVPFFRYKNAFQNPSISAIKNLSTKAGVLDFLIDKANYLSKTQHLKQALDTQLLVDSLIDLMRQEHSGQESKVFWRQKTHSFYENALETTFRLGDDAHAFYLMEKSRSILLLDALQSLNAKRVLKPEQQSQEQALRYEIIGLQRKIATIDIKNKEYPSVLQQLIEAKEKYQAFVNSLEKSNPTFYQLKYQNRYISLADWQNYLSDNQQTALQYFVGDSSMYVLATMPSKTIFRKIPLSNYKQLIQQFNELITLPPPHTRENLKQFQAVSNALYWLVIQDINLPKGRVIVSPDGYFIPFGALWTGSNYLVKDHAFSYVYSANILVKKQSKLWSFRKRFLGVSPVEFNNSLAVVSLAKSDEVAQRIEKQYFSGKVLAKREATKSNFLKDVGQYQIIQLFTHGITDSTDRGSKIYFCDDALSLSELYGLEALNADLVVLSACQTNLGQMATGEGILSLARGFAYLNVPSTVSTLWSINNEATYQITEAFYKYLNEGLPKDVALQKAQTEYLYDGQNKIPYFWAGMVLVGDSSPISSYMSIFWKVLAVFLAIFGILFYLYKKYLTGTFSKTSADSLQSP